MIELIQLESREEAVAKAAKTVGDAIRRASGPVLLLSSGGSALTILDSLDDSAVGAIDAMSMLDERFSREHKVNNFLQLAETKFYKRAGEHGTLFLPTIPYQHESREAFAGRFKGSLEAWLATNPNAFVVATLGIGADGHIGGMFPMPETEFKELFENEPTAVGYHAPKALITPERITVTSQFLRNTIAMAVLLALGEEKREALQKTTASGGLLYKTPARIIQEMPNVVICTDVQY